MHIAPIRAPSGLAISRLFFARIAACSVPTTAAATHVCYCGSPSVASAPNSFLWHIRQSQACRGWQTARQVAGRTHCIKPGSKPEDVVKRISKDDVQVNFARSGGAGGQNVNKVNTKVDMRLDLDQDWLSEEMRDALQRLEKKKINKEGELVLTSQKTRSQADNVEDALEKLQNCLDRAAESIIPAKPDPEKAKEIEKRKKVANENRIQNKKMKSEKKTLRKAKIDW